jgi:hypothetical protein
MMDSSSEITSKCSKDENSKSESLNQDVNQKVTVAMTLIFELYRVLTGTLLVLFVPQNCSGIICSTSENMNHSEEFHVFTVVYNFMTLASFIILYFNELNRENTMINYLEVNKFSPRDNESVGNALNKLDKSRKNKILKLDKVYNNSGYLTTFTFATNTIFSAIVIFNNYLDTTTYTVFLTNTLFIGQKVADVFSTVKTPCNVFLSAYLTRKIQYNDVDPDKIVSTNDNNNVNDESNHIIEDDEKNDVVVKYDNNTHNDSTEYKEDLVKDNTKTEMEINTHVNNDLNNKEVSSPKLNYIV